MAERQTSPILCDDHRESQARMIYATETARQNEERFLAESCPDCELPEAALGAT